MADIKHYVGEYGTPLIVKCGIELLGVTAVRVVVKKPDGTLASWVAEPYAMDGKLWYIRYVFVRGDLDQHGEYECHAEASFSGSVIQGETFQIVIYKEYA